MRNLRLSDKDKEAIAAIRERYGLASNADAIRLALAEWSKRLKEHHAGAAPPQVRYSNRIY